jgi:hypothetical protein
MMLQPTTSSRAIESGYYVACMPGNGMHEFNSLAATLEQQLQACNKAGDVTRKPCPPKAWRALQ